jgi:ABC-type transporter Mla subunit MlaD
VAENLKSALSQSKQVEESLQGIVSKAREVDSLVAEIAAATAEQSQGLEQVNTAVSQMDKVTQSNAANAEESASAAEELNAQASSLQDAVEQLSSLVGGRHLKDTTSKTDNSKKTIPNSVAPNNKTHISQGAQRKNGTGMPTKSKSSNTVKESDFDF